MCIYKHLQKYKHSNFSSFGIFIIVVVFLSDRMNLQTHTSLTFGGVTNPIAESKLDDVKFDFDESHIYDDPETLLSGTFISDVKSNKFDADSKIFCKVSANSLDPSAMTAHHKESVVQERKNIYQTPSSIPAGNIFGFEYHNEIKSTFKPSASSDLSSNGAEWGTGKKCSGQEKVTSHMPKLDEVSNLQKVENHYQMIPNELSPGAPVSGGVSSVAHDEDEYMIMSTPSKSPAFDSSSPAV